MAAAGISSFQIVATDNADPVIRDPRNNCNQGTYLCLSGWTSKSVSLPVRAGHTYSWTVRGVYSPAGRPTPLLGSIGTASFSVQAAIDAATFVNWSPPPSCMWPGSAVQVSVTMRNTGTTTWNSNFRLGSQNPQDNQTWGVGRVFLAPGETVSPTQSKTFSFNATAPTSPGSYNFQWQMVHESVRWFGSYTPNATVTNTAPSAPSGLYPNGTSLSAGATTVTLSWSPTPLATKYAVRLQDNTDGSLRSTWTCPGTPTIYLCVNDISSTSYSATVVPGHSYTWWVHAGDCVAYGSPTYASFSVPLAGPPSAPSGLTPNGVSLPAGSTSVTMRWTATPGATKYAVRLQDNTDGSLRSTWTCPGTPTIYLCVNDITPNSYTSPVVSGHSYTWWVHAGNNYGYSGPTYATFSVP